MLEQVQDSEKLEQSFHRRSLRSSVYLDPFLSNAPIQRVSAEMSFNNEFTKMPATNTLATSCPQGMGLNIMPSVGRFKDSDLVPSIYMKGNVPAYNAYSMAPQTNYGLLKDKQNRQHVGQWSTQSEASSNLGPEGKMNSSTSKKSM